MAAKIPSGCFRTQLSVKLQISALFLTNCDIAFLSTGYFSLSNNKILGYLYLSETLLKLSPICYKKCNKKCATLQLPLLGGVIITTLIGLLIINCDKQPQFCQQENFLSQTTLFFKTTQN